MFELLFNLLDFLRLHLISPSPCYPNVNLSVTNSRTPNSGGIRPGQSSTQARSSHSLAPWQISTFLIAAFPCAKGVVLLGGWSACTTNQLNPLYSSALSFGSTPLLARHHPTVSLVGRQVSFATAVISWFTIINTLKLELCHQPLPTYIYKKYSRTISMIIPILLLSCICTEKTPLGQSFLTRKLASPRWGSSIAKPMMP